MAEAEGFLTIGEARALLGVSKTKMAKILARGVLPSEEDPLDSRFKLVKRADVEALLARSKRAA
jgi:hypothetical protein